MSKKKAAAPAAETTAAAATPAEPKKPGKLDVIERAMRSATGASSAEILAKLKAAFPDADEKGMMTTVRIQVNRLPANREFAVRKEKIETRGLVYFGTPVLADEPVAVETAAE